MTEAEFDRRLMALVAAAAPEQAVGDLEGFLDMFSAIKNVMVSAGRGAVSVAGKVGHGVASVAKGIAPAAGKIAGGIGRAVASVGRGLTSPGGQALLATGGALYVQKQQLKMESKKADLQNALYAQGFAATSPQSQAFLSDIAREGVMTSDGRIVIPAGNLSRTGTGFNLEGFTPVLIAAAGLMAFAMLVPRGSKNA
jgi:hypothetical protein